VSASRRVGVAIAGAAGRMGRMLLNLALDDARIALVGAVEAPGHPDLGGDAGRLVGRPAAGVALRDRLDGLPAGSVLVEFTSPEASLAHLREAADRGIAVVLGTTGFGAEQQAEIDRLATRVACMQAPNMSVGITVLLDVVREVARRLGPAYDVELCETHHRRKKDAPSGTALALARAAAEGRGARLEDWAVYGREGIVGERRDAEMGVLALRGGDVVGDHTVFFLGTGERIEITHRAQSREAFAAGALRAAVWLAGREPGRYTMKDVLAAPPR
jgi:4-hydroxy-tetrahydrodipicolinate reductase